MGIMVYSLLRVMQDLYHQHDMGARRPKLNRQPLNLAISIILGLGFRWLGFRV